MGLLDGCDHTTGWGCGVLLMLDPGLPGVGMGPTCIYCGPA